MASIPPHWSWVKLGDICEIDSGIGFPKKFQGIEKGKYPFYKVRDISNTFLNKEQYLSVANHYIDDDILNELNGKLIPKNSIVFAKIGEALRLNRRAITSVKCLVDNNVMIVKSRPEITDYLYLFYFLFTKNLGELSRSTTVPSIRKSDVEEIPFPLPPLTEQKKIVEKIEELFSGLDSGVASLKKAKEQIKLYRQSVLAYAFSGRLCKNLINQIPTENNLPEGLPAEDLTKAGWKWVKLGEIIKVSSGKGLTSEKMVSNGNYAVYGGNGISGYYNEYLFEEPRLIIGRVGAKCGVMHITKTNSWVTDNALVVDFITKDVEKKFLYHCLGYHNLNKLSVSTAQPVISGAKIYPYQIMLPPLEQQTQIVEEIEKRFSEADNLEKAIDESLEKSEALRQSILKQAFEGKLV